MNFWGTSLFANGLRHVLFGWIIIVPLYFLLVWLDFTRGQSLFVAWLGQSYYWLGRERRDHEVEYGGEPLDFWYKQWNIFRSKVGTQVDLWSPLIVNGLILTAVFYLWVQRALG